MKRDDLAAKLGAKAAYNDDATGVVKVLLKGGSFNVKGLSTLADKDGNRLTDLEFDYLADSACGLFRVHLLGGRYGYVNPLGEFVIDPIYDWAADFSEDLAWVAREGRALILRKDGTEITPEPLPDGEYSRVEPFHQGLARVSIVDMGGFWGFMSLAYHHDEADNAGVWGYVNGEGRIVVKPQYIFAEDFSGVRLTLRVASPYRVSSTRLNGGLGRMNGVARRSCRKSISRSVMSMGNAD